MKITEKKERLIRRRFKRAVRKHTTLLLIQVIFSALVTFLWYVCVWRFQVHIQRGDTEYFFAGVIFLGSAAWVLKGTEMLRVIWAQYREMVVAVKRADTTKIIELKDEHIPLLMHFYLALLAIMTDGVMWFVPYRSVYDGAAAIFLVTLVFTFFAAIILQFEDPTEDGWVRDQIMRYNPKLLEQDSEEFFAEKWDFHLEERKDG